MSERPAWHTDEFPELRSGPPWVTEEMVAAQPGLARQMLSSPPEGIVDLAAAIRSGEPVTVVGCGTSEHGALAIAALVERGAGWRAGRRRSWPASRSTRPSEPQRGGVCIGISHDGGTRATTLALEAAAATGLRPRSSRTGRAARPPGPRSA